MEPNKEFSSGQGVGGDTWYVDNYILLKEYYDMTISRIAARCVRQGNIAMEEYKYYPYILDVLEEISETGEYILSHPDLFGYVEKKIAGGVNSLKKNLKEFKSELEQNASPDMIKQDGNELNKMKEALGEIDKSDDPTSGAGMSMDEVINKLMKQNNIEQTQYEDETPAPQPRPQPQGQQPRPQPQGQQPRPQPQGQQPRPQPQGQQPRPQPQGQQPRPQPQGQQPRPQQ